MSTTAQMVKAIEENNGDVNATLRALDYRTPAAKCLRTKLQNFARRNPGVTPSTFTVGRMAFVEVA